MAAANVLDALREISESFQRVETLAGGQRAVLGAKLTLKGDLQS